MTNLLQFSINTRNPTKSRRSSHSSYKAHSCWHISQKHAVEYEAVLSPLHSPKGQTSCSSWNITEVNTVLTARTIIVNCNGG